MRRLMLEGASAGEAARVALETDVDPLLAGDPTGRAGPPGAAAPSRRRPSRWRSGGPAARRDPGSPRARPRGHGPRQRRLHRAAARQPGPVRASCPPGTTCCCPSWADVGDRWRSTGAGVEVEHLLSECAEVALRSVPAPAGRAPNSRPVLLAALEPEDHRLPLVALAAALTERRVATRPLGTRLPSRALVDAVSRTGALAVFLWAQGATGPVRLPDGDALGVIRPRPAVLLGGPGWDNHGGPGRGDPGDRPRVGGHRGPGVSSRAACPHGRPRARRTGRGSRGQAWPTTSRGCWPRGSGLPSTAGRRPASTRCAGPWPRDRGRADRGGGRGGLAARCLPGVRRPVRRRADRPRPSGGRRRLPGEPDVAALATATVASVHRQLGRHAVAQGYDERALDGSGGPGEAGFDALLGLAADAVGLGGGGRRRPAGRGDGAGRRPRRLVAPAGPARVGAGGGRPARGRAEDAARRRTSRSTSPSSPERRATWRRVCSSSACPRWRPAGRRGGGILRRAGCSPRASARCPCCGPSAPC